MSKAPGLSCGIVGLPNVGKSTLFNALTKKSAPASNYPFCTIDPNIGIVEVPDPRLKVLAQMSKSQKVVPATVTFVDIAGLVKGASQGEGLGNKFLSHIRETDAIIHVVRCFENEQVIHVEGKIDPIKDIEVIQLELILADLQMAQNTYAKLEKQAKGHKELLSTIEVLKKVIQTLNDGMPIRLLSLTEEEKKILNPYPFLTAKKVIYLANVSEDTLPHMENSFVKKVKEYAQKEKSAVVPICAKLEAELAEFPSEQEALDYLHALGLKESGLSSLIKKSYQLLNLITFITTGELETKAWTIEKGDTAQIAAGKIHTDIQKGFIRAEVIPYEDYVKYGRVGAKEAGKARAEGKDYVVHDGDVLLFFHAL